MTKKFFRNTIIFFTFVLGGFFLNSCSDMNLLSLEENTPSGFAEISFAIGDSISDVDARTALPKSDEHDLTKYLYLYNYTLTYVNENGEEDNGEEVIICNDLSYDKFLTDSTIRLATGNKYKFTLKAKDGNIVRMEGSSIIQLGSVPKPQTVTIVLVPATDEVGQKFRVDWIVPDDGVITTMKAGISPKRGYAEFQTEDEILDAEKKYKFQEYAFSVLKNPDENPHKSDYGETIKRIGLTFDGVKTGVPRWLDYKFYDANGILVYESSESIYMIGGKTTSTVIYITPDHYYRRPVSIPVFKDGQDGVRWAQDPELKVMLVDENGNKYIFKPVVKDGKLTFEGLLPGASGGVDSKNTDGIFDIWVTLDEDEDAENGGYIKTGAKYDANNGKISGNGGEGIGSGSTDTVELVTVSALQNGVTFTPVSGVVGTEGGLIVPAGQNFTVQVNLDLGYAAKAGNTITVGGKTVANGGKVTLNANDVKDGISIGNIEAIEYNLVYKNGEDSISWGGNIQPESFTIESAEINLPDATAIENAGISKDGYNFDGWWFGNKDNIIHKINAEKALKEKLIASADAHNNVVLNVNWIESDYVEYRIEYKFQELGGSGNFITDDTIVDVNGNKVVSFHNIVVEKNSSVTIPYGTVIIPDVPGFTHPASVTINVGETGGTQEIRYTRKTITITLDGNYGNWTDGKSTDTKTLTGQYGGSHPHVDDPVREGYKFAGWYRKGDANQEVIKHVDDHRFPADSVEYVAKWEQTLAAYTVEYYFENEDSTAYVIDEVNYKATSHPTGTIGAFPAFDTTPLKGFTYNAAKREIKANGEDVNAVTEDGNTIVKLYFNRKTVEFTLKANGGKFTDKNGKLTDEIILEGKFGTPLGYPANFRPQSPVLDEYAENDGSSLATDFDFKEWHVGTNMPAATELPATFPAENSIYAARWTQKNGLYKVIHWAESMDKKADGSGYKLLVPNERDGFSGEMLEGSVTKKGKLGNTMVYFHAPVTGFVTPTVESSTIEYKYTDDRTIKADGKAEVIVTYLRKTYAIRFHLNAGDDSNADWYGTDKGRGETVIRTGKYRTDFTPPANPIRTHFIFRGWTIDPNGTLADRVDVVPSFTEDAPQDYYAVWYSKASGGLDTDQPDITLTCTVTGTTITANAGTPEGEGEWTFLWSVNNLPLSEITGATLSGDHKVLTIKNCLYKDYEITVVAKHNGKVYTKTQTKTVSKSE